MFSEDQLKWYDKVGKGRPTHISHGITSDNINDHMKQLKITNWHLRGNQLHGETEMGPFVQGIPTNVILSGEDENGMPIFKQIELQ